MSTIGGQAQQSERVAVIVTHGVGEAAPGECVATLVKVLGTQKGVETEEAAEVLTLSQEEVPFERTPVDGSINGGKEPLSTFPVVVRHATVDQRHCLTFAELHWADLTRIGEGRIASMLGLFRVIFEAHYVIDAMLDPRLGPAVRGLRLVLLWLSWLMRGPIAGLSGATVAVFWAALYLRPGGLFGQWRLQFVFATVLAILFLLTLAVRAWSEKRWDATWRTSLNWLLIVSAFFAVLSLNAPSVVTHALYYPADFTLSHWPVQYRWAEPTGVAAPDFTQRAHFVNLLYRNLTRLWVLFGIVWMMIGLTLLTYIGVASYLRKRRRARFEPALTATGILTLQLALWTALVGTAILPLLNRAQEAIAVTELRPALQKDAPELRVAEVERFLDVASFPKADYDWVPRFVFAYGFNGLIVSTIMIAGVGIVLFRRRRAAGAQGKDAQALRETAQSLPRLLFSWPLMALLIGLTLIQLTFHIMFGAATYKGEIAKAIGDFISQFISKAHVGDIKGFFEQLFGTYLNVTMSIAWGLALLFPLLLGKGFNNAVHIARDLIDHQYGPQRGRVLGVRRDRRLPYADRWPRRERIRLRLERLLAALAKRHSYDRVVFLAHSQGSVVIFDYLREASLAAPSLPAGPTDIITFGSPLGHIYQHYFQEYAGLEAELLRLRKRTRSWINLYRIDDYIGVWVGSLEGGAVDNRAMGPGGHIDYWCEEKLAATILEVIRCPQSQHLGIAHA